MSIKRVMERITKEQRDSVELSKEQVELASSSEMKAITKELKALTKKLSPLSKKLKELEKVKKEAASEMDGADKLYAKALSLGREFFKDAKELGFNPTESKPFMEMADAREEMQKLNMDIDKQLR